MSYKVWLEKHTNTINLDTFDKKSLTFVEPLTRNLKITEFRQIVQNYRVLRWTLKSCEFWQFSWSLILVKSFSVELWSNLEQTCGASNWQKTTLKKPWSFRFDVVSLQGNQSFWLCWPFSWSSKLETSFSVELLSNLEHKCGALNS